MRERDRTKERKREKKKVRKKSTRKIFFFEKKIRVPIRRGPLRLAPRDSGVLVASRQRKTPPNRYNVASFLESQPASKQQPFTIQKTNRKFKCFKLSMNEAINKGERKVIKPEIRTKANSKISLIVKAR